jgi:fumarate reductase flavoprotein subunit
MSDWDLETELLVIGGGGCGLMAAFVAARLGIEVVLIEKSRAVGCNTEIASGSIPATGTRFQKAAGITGTPEQMAEDILRKNGGQADAGLVNLLCRRSPDIIDTLVDQVGLPMFLNTDAGRAGFSFLRLHNPPGRTGGPLIQALYEAFTREPTATYADETPGAGLITDADGAVIGALAGRDAELRIRARKVLLACDGFGANRELIARHIPEAAGMEYIGTNNNTGDGVRWGLALGAATRHMSSYQGHGYVCAGYGTRLSPEIPQLGGIFVNEEALRFTRDDMGYSEFAREVQAQPGGVAYGVFDQRIHDVVAHTSHFKDTIASGALRSAQSIEALAQALHLDPDTLRKTVDEYNDGVGLGVDRYGRKALTQPLAAPFYGAKVSGALAHTQGGLRIDLQARVLTEAGQIIPNLYAGGGTAAGISGNGCDGYMSGNGLLSALGLGLIAAEHAAAAIRGAC